MKKPWLTLASRSMSTAERFWARVQVGDHDDCWPWRLVPGKVGYGRFQACAGKQVAAHRMAWELTNGAVPKGLWVCHRCDNRRCCNPGHLFLGTPADNTHDMMSKGRMVPPPILDGARANGAKLTEAVVADVVQRLAAGETGRSIAKSIGVTETTVSGIKHGRIWRKVRKAMEGRA